jgi:hypothetical protein
LVYIADLAIFTTVTILEDIAMTRDEASSVIDSVMSDEAPMIGEAILMFRRWRANGLDSAQVVNIINQLKPTQVLHLAGIAERKIARRNLALEPRR